MLKKMLRYLNEIEKHSKQNDIIIVTFLKHKDIIYDGTWQTIGTQKSQA